MSKPRRISDSERTATMLDLLTQKYSGSGMTKPYVVIEEVAPTTGFGAVCRYADALVLGVWPSKGLLLHGFELKASKADLKRELSKPTKHHALARYCDTWTLLAWDETVLVDGIPEDWGILLTAGEDHDRKLTQKRAAPRRTPLPWTRGFVCSLVRNAHEQSPGAAYVARAALAAAELARGHSERAEKHDRERLTRPLAEMLYGKSSWNWPKEASDPEAVIRLAVERLAQSLTS